MKKITLLFYLLCGSLFAFAQGREFILRDLQFPKHFKNQIIKHVAEDKAGLLWFVTSTGLYRYDGNEIVHFGEKKDSALLKKNIESIKVDQQNNLWIGYKNGFRRLNLNTWALTTLKFPAGLPAISRYIKSIGQGRNGSIYAGSQDGKLYHVVGDSLEMILDINRDIPGKYNLPFITFITNPYPGQIWIGSATGKLIRIRIKDGHFEPPEYFGLKKFEDEAIVTFDFNASGRCLVAVPHHGLYLLDTRDGSFRKIDGPYGDLGVENQVFIQPLDARKAMLLTNSPEIGKNNLFIYDFKKDTFTVKKLHFPVFLNKNHFVWFAHLRNKILLSLNGHIMELKPTQTPFKTFLVDANALSSIRCIYKKPGGPLYVGSYRDGFIKLDEQTGNKKLIARKYVYCILPWNKDSLLLGTEGNGLYWYEPATDKLSHLSLRPGKKGDRPMGRYITTLTREGKHTFLAGTYTGLFLINPYLKKTYPIQDDRMSRLKILNILKGDKQHLIATQYGILKWNSRTDSLTEFTHAIQNKETIYCLASVNNEIWAGTGGAGVLVLDKKGRLLDALDNNKGLAGNIVYSLTSVGGYVFAGTENGLSVIDARQKKIKNYSHPGYLPVDEFNSAATFHTGDTVYLGTIDGLIRFNTRHLNLLKQPLLHFPLHLTHLTVGYHNDKSVQDYTWPYRENAKLVVPSDAGYFSLGFGTTEATVHPLDYYYRLHAANKWNLIGQRKKINFVGMAPGDYRLQLKARLPDGQWTSSLLTVPLIVKPAFYQTLWFKLMLVLVIVVLIWAIFKYREKEKEKERVIRLQIAGDLHDEVGSTLAGISMQADMLLHGKKDKQEQYLKNIADSGRSAVQTMGDIVWSIDPRNDDGHSLSNRLKRYAERVFDGSDIRLFFHINSRSEQVYVSQKIRQNVMLIVKEALTNISKHAEASVVDISFSSNKKIVELMIADNGKGLPADHSGGHGLRNMQMRADAIGAELLLSDDSKGVKIVLRWKA